MIGLIFPRWPLLLMVALSVQMACGSLSAQTCDTTDWALVLIGPSDYQVPIGGGGLLPLGGAYLLGKGDTAAQIAAVLRFEERLAYNRTMRPRDYQRLYQVQVMHWWTAFYAGRKIVLHPLPTFLYDKHISIHELKLKFRSDGGGHVSRTIDYYLMRIPLSVLIQPG